MDGCLEFYTYVHSTPDGDVFYIGKGKFKTKEAAMSIANEFKSFALQEASV